MGIFDSIFGGVGADQHFGPQEGFAGVLLCAAACDGHIGDEEVQSLMTTLARMRLYQNMTSQRFNSMMDRLLGLLKRSGPEKLSEKAVPAVPPELRETVFAGACDLVLADGVVEDAEKKFLNDLMHRLEISGDRALTIVDVMVVKNKG
jgi:uncharacterized membrane protein YebE (DUF533 family)